MDKITRNWFVVGVVQNWETALSQPVPLWGLKTRYQPEFQTLNIGDMLWFYATAPVKGIIGLEKKGDSDLFIILTYSCFFAFYRCYHLERLNRLINSILLSKIKTLISLTSKLICANIPSTVISKF